MFRKKVARPLGALAGDGETILPLLCRDAHLLHPGTQGGEVAVELYGALRVLVLELLRAAVGSDEPAIQDHHAVGTVCLLHVVGGEKDGHLRLAAQPLHRLPHHAVRLRV